MACDTDDKNTNYDYAFAITTNPFMNISCARTLYSIEKYDSNNKDDSVHFGEKVCIVAHPDVYSKKVYFDLFTIIVIFILYLNLPTKLL
jgi:hypothetical protein